MTPPLVLVTGFGPFLDAVRNPSGEIARALGESPPAGIDIASTVLPVSFVQVPTALEAVLAGLLPRVPDLLLGLGLHREPGLRLEARARSTLTSAKPDVDGAFAASLGALAGGELRTALDLEPLAAALRAAGAGDVRVSEDAGGYVCERTYHALLTAGARSSSPALFLHVPSADHIEPERQAALVRAWLPGVLEHARSTARRRGE